MAKSTAMVSDDNLPAKREGMKTYEIMTLGKEELTELIRANIGPQGISPFLLERVKIPAGGGTHWLVPSIESAKEVPQEALEGIIIHFRDLRSYWSTKPGETGISNRPPDCMSEDALMGNGVRWAGDKAEFHDCMTCPHARFGSDPKGGRGQACGARKAIFLVRKEQILPTVLLLPATSIQPVEKFFLKLLSHRIPFFGCEVRFGLEKAMNATGQPYAKVVPSLTRRITDAEELARIKNARDGLVPALNKTRISVEDDGMGVSASSGAA